MPTSLNLRSSKRLLSSSRAYLGLMVVPMLSGAALAQNIQTDQLGTARAFNAGALPQSDSSLALDLGPSLWAATPYDLARQIIESAPIRSQTPIIRDLVRAALLSAGEPPSGDRDAFEIARLRAVMTMGDETATSLLSSRNPVLAQSPSFRAQRALSKKQDIEACEISDQTTTGRAEPQWARLRIVCHVIRGEIAAAELTRDLLKNSGYEDANYFALLAIMIRASNDAEIKGKLPPASGSDDALIDFMRASLAAKLKGDEKPLVDKAVAFDNSQQAQLRMDALWANLDGIDINEMTAILSDIAFDANDIAGSSSFDLNSASARETPQTTAQLFLLSRSGDLGAITAFTERAPEPQQKDLRSKLRKAYAPLTAADMAAEDLGGFAQKAIDMRDISRLRALHEASKDETRKSRLALATDAVGNGFNFGPLGRDIDTRLASAQVDIISRARRDAMIALAMGAQMSPAAKKALAGYNFEDGRAIAHGDKAILQQAAKAGSRAELALRSAQVLDGSRLDTPSLSFLIQTLQSAGLPQFAGRIAAQDFVFGL